jgi:hypothetical protein
VSTSTSTRRAPEPPCPADRPNDTAAISTNPSPQIVSMIACARVRMAYAKVASMSAATTKPVTARLTSSAPQLITAPSGRCWPSVRRSARRTR